MDIAVHEAQHLPSPAAWEIAMNRMPERSRFAKVAQATAYGAWAASILLVYAGCTIATGSGGSGGNPPTTGLLNLTLGYGAVSEPPSLCGGGGTVTAVLA